MVSVFGIPCALLLALTPFSLSAHSSLYGCQPLVIDGQLPEAGVLGWLLVHWSVVLACCSACQTASRQLVTTDRARVTSPPAHTIRVPNECRPQALMTPRLLLGSAPAFRLGDRILRANLERLDCKTRILLLGAQWNPLGPTPRFCSGVWPGHQQF